MFITPAYAQAAAGTPDTLMTVLPFALMFVVIYFLMIRPQQQKQKQVKKMIEALRRGDRVVTAGGLIGTIAKADADEVLVEIAEGVRVKVVRSTISTVLVKPEPVAAKKKDESGADRPGDRKDKTPEPAEAANDGGMMDKIRGFLGR